MQKETNLLNGWLCVDKPLGMTSTQVVSQVRKALKIKKIGHGGTLDPLASGVLPLAIGEATKTVPYIQDGLKTYEFEVTWGEARSTDDREGEIIATSEVLPTEEAIRSCLPRFIGMIKQIPPQYSAIKIQGQRAYALARQGETVSLKSRQVYVQDLKLLKIASPQSAFFQVICGKGTYVRSLGRDMAETLGTVGYISSLKRLRVGTFSIDRALQVEKVLALGGQVVLNRAWYSIREALDDILAFTVSDDQEKRLRCGQRLEYPDKYHLEKRVLCISQGKVPVALALLREGYLMPERVFNI